jgi:hypothetical protein
MAHIEPANTEPEPEPSGSLSGSLSIYVAFDWGDEIDLALARQLGPSVVLDLSRRPRTPASIAYKPPPLRFPLGPMAVDLPGLPGTTVRNPEATLFDFGAVSVALQVPFHLSAHELRSLADRLSDPQVTASVLRAARMAVEPLHQRLFPAIQKPHWSDTMWEEYYVSQFPPGAPLRPESMLGEFGYWLAGLLRLEDQPLSAQEAEQALRLSLRYGTEDLFVPDWAAAVLVDQEGSYNETLQAIEFANLQLLEYRHIDDRLDTVLAQASQMLQRATRSRLPAWRGHHNLLRSLGELKVEATGLFERTGNVLKLVGDQYLARVYRLLSTRFHLPEWERSIRRKLEVLEGIYEVISHQSASFRTEFLEIVVILLITIEILLALFKH